MAITKEKKKEIVSNLGEIIKKSPSVVFLNFHKLLVSEVSSVRRNLKKEGVGYLVTKKSLFKRVLDGASVKGNKPALEGELAISYLSAEALAKADLDMLTPARSIYEFEKKLLGKVSIMGGIFDGEYKSKGEMVSLASIPSLQILRGMFVNIINSPIQRFAIALNQIAVTKN